MTAARSQQGLTLLELLIAIAIFAVMAALAYGGLRSVLDSREAIEQQAEELASLQKVFFRIQYDIGQAVARGIRDGFGDLQPAFVAADGKLIDAENSVEFTVTGRFNPSGKARSAMQRIAYSLEEGKLIRQSWNVLDRAQDSVAAKYVLLDEVKAIEFRFLDESGSWQTSWETQPLEAQVINEEIVAGAINVAAEDVALPVPVAVELSMDLENMGRVTRIIRVF